MNEAVKKKWLEALRNGEFAQGRGRLRDGDTYCCLGVLCELYRRDNPEYGHWFEREPGRYVFRVPHTGYSATLLPAPVKHWAGLDSAVPRVSSTSEGDRMDNTVGLDTMNDSGKSFDEIAYRIERDL